MRIDEKGRILMSLDELAEADEEGRVKSVPVSDVGLEKIVEVGLAMKSFEIEKY